MQDVDRLCALAYTIRTLMRWLPKVAPTGTLTEPVIVVELDELLLPMNSPTSPKLPLSLKSIHQPVFSLLLYPARMVKGYTPPCCMFTVMLV